MRPGEHRCLVFDAPEERAAVQAVYVAAGLAERQKVIVLGADPPEAADVPGARMGLGFLSAHGLDPTPYLASGRLVAAASAATGTAGLLHAVRAALDSGVPAVRICRDAPRSLPAHELRRAEEQLCRAFSGLPVLLLCSYSRAAFTGTELDAVLAGHDGQVGPDPLHEDSLLRVTRQFAPPALRLEGDLDASNVPRLAKLLHAECARLRERPGEPGRPAALRLEAAGLEFIDVSGMRLLVQTALGLHEESGRRLVIAGLAPHLRRVMHVVGWDLTPGLELLTEYGPASYEPNAIPPQASRESAASTAPRPGHAHGREPA